MIKGLLLFDIDGTLLHAPGAGRTAFPLAFEEALGWDQTVEHVNFFGATDLGVFRNICAERGVESTGEMERSFFKCLGPVLDAQLAKVPPVVFPNIENLLEKISGAGGWKLGIVTGNIESTARAKLRHAGLADYFSFGGFGCWHADRVEIARQAVSASGIKNPKKVFLIGDTPSDINAARVNGFISIAVATGGFDFPALEKAGADYVFEDFNELDRFLSILETA